MQLPPADISGADDASCGAQSKARFCPFRQKRHNTILHVVHTVGTRRYISIGRLDKVVGGGINARIKNTHHSAGLDNTHRKIIVISYCTSYLEELLNWTCISSSLPFSKCYFWYSLVYNT